MPRTLRGRPTAAPDAPLPTLTVNDAQLAYEVDGDSGPLVVQLHGLTSSRARDERLRLDVPRILSGHRVLRYDARGHGESTGTTAPRSYTWPRLADDLLALLDHVAPGEPVHGVGPSMGSATLLFAAMRDPARFTSLTLLVPPTAWETRVSQRATYLFNAALIEREGMEPFVELAQSAPIVPAMANAPWTRPEVPERLLPALLRGAAMCDLPPRQELGAIDTPTLLLAWTDDPTHPVSTATRLDQALPNSQLVVARTPYGVMAWPGLFADHAASLEQGVERRR